MKIISLNCPNCSAHLTVASDKKEAKCEYCGATFLIDDESIYVDFDAEQAGAGSSESKAAVWIVLGVLLFLVVSMLVKCNSAASSSKDVQEEAHTVVEEVAAEEPDEAILDLESEELSNEPVASNNESQDPLGVVEVKGRGFCDDGYKEPNYVGLSGYVSIYKYDEPMLSLYEIPIEPWYVPKYALYEGKYIDTEDKVEHKTPVKVLEQSLYYEDTAKYGGYLLVEDEKEEQFFINVSNFITKDYWNDDDLSKALETGYYLAVYHQRSNISPVTHDNEETDLEDGTLVFVRNFVPGEWSVNVNKPHPDTTQIEGLVWGGWYNVNEYGARGICFNVEDLEIVY